MNGLAGTGKEGGLDAVAVAGGARIQFPVPLSEQIYQILKQRIVDGVLEPGSRLVERKLAAEFGTSKTPVREALLRLERESLVSFLERGGAIVREPTLQEVLDLLEVREYLDGLAAMLAAQRASDGNLEELVRSFNLLEAHVSAGDEEAYKLEDLRFHRLIRQMSGNQVLCAIMDSLSDRLRYLLTRSMRFPDRGPVVSIEEHRRILEAVRLRDDKEAAEISRKHVRAVREAVLKERGLRKGGLE